jgi:Acyl-CoA dehydrogenases
MDTPGVKLGACYETMMGDKPWEIVLENVRVPAPTASARKVTACASASNGLISAASSTARVRSASPSVAWKWRLLRQAALDLWPAAGRPPSGAMDVGRHVHRVAGRPPARLQDRARLDQGEEAREDAYVAKYFADEMAFKAADQCMQIHGGIALTTDLPIEKMWRQQRSYRITEGASEVMKMVIAPCAQDLRLRETP